MMVRKIILFLAKRHVYILYGTSVVIWQEHQKMYLFFLLNVQNDINFTVCVSNWNPHVKK